MGKLIWAVIIVLLIGGYMVKTGLDTDFGNSQDRSNFIWTFLKWIGKVGGNVKQTAGYAVAQDWKPDLPSQNDSNETTFAIE